MPIFDDDVKDTSKPAAPAATKSTQSKAAEIKASVKERLMAEHIAPFDNYKPASGTEHLYHVLVEHVQVRDLDFKSNAHIATVSQKEFVQWYAHFQAVGLTLHRIAHDPAPEQTPKRIEAAMNIREGKPTKSE